MKSKRSNRAPLIRNFVSQWIHDHTTPSSNSRNVIHFKQNDQVITHVIHWRTDTIAVLYARCRRVVFSKFCQTISKSMFFTCIPPYVRLKRKQDGLCPVHYTATFLRKEFARKRLVWHRNCKCSCRFCQSSGCNHGQSPLNGSCSLFTCQRCSKVKCPREFIGARTRWLRPVQKKREGGGLYWANEEIVEPRSDMVKTFKKEMKSFHTHSEHVEHSKEQMRQLQEHLPRDEIIVKADFIQNIVHDRGRETSQSYYYGKRQTQFLCFVVWFYSCNAGVWKRNKYHFDYLSSYLKHNSLFFQKCFLHLLVFLQVTFGVAFKKVYYLIGAPICHCSYFT